jgi:anti-sigma-K factor RskA
MKQDIEEDIIRKYLMGDLQLQEQLQVEERLFLDSEYLRTLKAVEDELVDDYVYGELSTDERARFEKYFMSTPERQEALTVAQALKRYVPTNNSLPATSAEIAAAATVTQPIPPQTIPAKVTFFPFRRAQQPAWRLALAAAVILIAVVAAWFIVRNFQRANSNSPSQAKEPLLKEPTQPRQPAKGSEQARDVPSNTNSQPPQEQVVEQREQPATGPKVDGTTGGNNQARPPVASGKQPTAHLYTVVILPGGITRGGGGEITKLEFRNGPGFANLQLALLSEDEFQIYSATLFSDEDRPLQNWTGLKSTDGQEGKIISVRVPTALLPAGTYHLKLRATAANGDRQDIGTYYFKVLNR